MKRTANAWIRCLTTLAVLAVALLFSRSAPGADGFAARDFRLLPVRVHLLTATAAPELNCELKASDVRRILGKVNDIWKPAGLLFYAESVRREAAANQELYAALGENRTFAHLQQIRPRASRAPRMVHVYYLHQMRANGVILGADYRLIFVKDTSRLRPTPGGIDEPLPRVTAHEIGHGLGLPHRQDFTNLLASGTTGTSLNAAEIHTARATAGRWTWALSPAAADARAAALWSGKKRDAARALYTALARLPGDDVLTRRARARAQTADASP